MKEFNNDSGKGPGGVGWFSSDNRSFIRVENAGKEAFVWGAAAANQGRAGFAWGLQPLLGLGPSHRKRPPNVINSFTPTPFYDYHHYSRIIYKNIFIYIYKTTKNTAARTVHENIWGILYFSANLEDAVIYNGCLARNYRRIKN